MMVATVLVKSMTKSTQHSNSITIPSNVVRDIWYWLEGKRDPNDPIKNVTIEVTETGIGPHIKVHLQTRPGEGVFKDFSEYDKW